MEAEKRVEKNTQKRRKMLDKVNSTNVKNIDNRNFHNKK